MDYEMDVVRAVTSEASNKMQSEVVVKDTTPLSPFETLNDDCLMELFDRLELIDLIKMFDVNKRCRRIVKDGLLNINKLIDIDKLKKVASTAWIFKVFGTRMTKLKIFEATLIFIRTNNEPKLFEAR